MRRFLSQIRSNAAAKLLTAILSAGLPLASLAQNAPPAAYDADVRAKAMQYMLTRDQSDLDAAKHRFDDIAAAKDRQTKELTAMRQGADAPVDTRRADLDRATADQLKAREAGKSLQQQLETAKAKVEQMHADALSKFEATDAFKSNFATFDQARKDLKGPTDAVLDKLAMTREFQDLVTAARTAKAKEAKLRADRDADPRAVATAEEEFIKADNQVQDTEEKALSADPAIVAGRKKVDAAQSVLQQIREKMEQDLKNDPMFAGALADVQKSESAIADASADQKRADTQLAAIGPATTAPAEAARPNPDAVRDAEAKLNNINRDLDQARQEVDKYTARVREDKDGMDSAARDRDAAAQPPTEAPVANSPPPNSVYADTQVASGPVYTPYPSDPPVVVYDSSSYGPVYSYYGSAYNSGLYIYAGTGYYYGDGYGYRSRYYSNYGGHYSRWNEYTPSYYRSSDGRGSSYNYRSRETSPVYRERTDTRESPRYQGSRSTDDANRQRGSSGTTSHREAYIQPQQQSPQYHTPQSHIAPSESRHPESAPARRAEPSHASESTSSSHHSGGESQSQGANDGRSRGR